MSSTVEIKDISPRALYIGFGLLGLAAAVSLLLVGLDDFEGALLTLLISLLSWCLWCAMLLARAVGDLPSWLGG